MRSAGFCRASTDRGHPAYPGLVLAIIPGRDPCWHGASTILKRRFSPAGLIRTRIIRRPRHWRNWRRWRKRPATPELPSPRHTPNRSPSEFWQAIASFFRTILRLLRWTWSVGMEADRCCRCHHCRHCVAAGRFAGTGKENPGNAAASCHHCLLLRARPGARQPAVQRLLQHRQPRKPWREESSLSAQKPGQRPL